MTPNDALSRSQTLHSIVGSGGGSSSTSSTSPLKRRLTRSPSPKVTSMVHHNYHDSTSATTATSGNAPATLSKRGSSFRRSDGVSSSGSGSCDSMKSSHVNGSLTANGYASLAMNGGGNAMLEGVAEVDDPPAHDGKPLKENGKTLKIDWEIPRKTLHSSIGFLTLGLYTSSHSPQPVIVVLSGSLVAIVAADVLRFRYPKIEIMYEKALGFLMRESEKKQVNGVVWYITGVLFALSVYPLDIAVVSILILSWADTAASTIGRLYGRYTPALPTSILRIPLPISSPSHLRLGFASRKSTAGFLAATVTGALIAAAFWGYFAPMSVTTEAAWSWSKGSWWGLAGLSVAAGLISGVAEALDLGSLDDNLTLPILSGGAIWAYLAMTC